MLPKKFIALVGRPSVAAAVVGPSVRNVTTGTVTSGTTTITLPTRSSGDTLVVVLAGQDSPFASAGWTRRINNGLTDLVTFCSIYTRQSDGTDSSPFNTNLMATCAYTAFSVQNPATGHDVVTGSSGASGSVVAPSISVTATNDVLISAYATNSTSTTYTLPGTQTTTTRVTATGVSLQCGYETLSASGATGTRTATNSNSAPWSGINTSVK